MPRQATRSAARGPLDKLRGPVRKMAEEVFSLDSDRTVLKDEPLLNGLSELQTKQALKVLDTYSANIQRQGSGRIQNKAAYLMSLIQSYKLGPNSGSPGSAQRLIERLSPPVRRAVEGVFDPVVDRIVLEDRALMELLAKVPEEQALAALKKYRATVQRRGRDAIDNRCGYLIGFLKQYQDGVAIVGVPGNPVHASRNAPALASNSDGVSPSNSSTAQSSSAHTSNNLVANGPRSGITTGNGGPSPASSGQGIAAANGSGNAFGGRPISYLQAPVRKQLEKLFESGKDKAVLEDVGLIKQLARLSEEQALAALKNYKEASKHRRDIHNKSAYLMGILRGYIEGTTPISKAPWEACSSGSSDDGPEASSAASTMPPSTSGTATTRMRGGRGRGPDSVADDVESNDAIPMPESNGAESSPQLPVPPTVPSLEASGPREMGGFASAPPVQLTEPSQSEEPPLPMAPMPARPSTSPVTPPDLVNHGIFLSGIGHNHSSGGLEPSQHRYDPSSSLLYLDGGGGVPDFGAHVHPSAHEQPPRHASPHQALFGHSLNANNPGGQQQPLVGPGLLGGDFLSNSGGGDRGLTLSGGGLTTAAASTVHTCGPGSPSNQALFGSGLLAGDEFDSCYSGNLGNIIPGSPSSTLGSLSGLGSNSLSGAGSRAESPLGSDAGNDTTTVTSATTTSSAGSLSLTGNPSCNGSTDLPPENFSPRSGEGRENSDSNGNALVAGMVDMLARLNLSKYVPVLAEAEVDMDALRLFGEDDLKDLGFPKGPRIKLLHEVQNLNFSNTTRA